MTDEILPPRTKITRITTRMQLVPHQKHENIQVNAAEED
jgi:hypothetical protein